MPLGMVVYCKTDIISSRHDITEKIVLLAESYNYSLFSVRNITCTDIFSIDTKV